MKFKEILTGCTIGDLEELHDKLTSVQMLLERNMPANYSDVDRMLCMDEYRQIRFMQTYAFAELQRRELMKISV